jgi:hypothetical protein
MPQLSSMNFSPWAFVRDNARVRLEREGMILAGEKIKARGI